MPNKKDIKLDKYGISKLAYRELYNFCLQYEEKKEKLSNIRSLKVQKLSNMPHGTSIGDPTGRNAVLAAQLSGDCELIEQCAIAVGGMFYPWLFDGVTVEHCSYEVMNNDDFYRGKIPIGINTYYRMRRQFFWLLAIKKGVISA